MTNPAADTTIPGALTSHAITVLLVDDQAMIGEAVRRMLAGEEDVSLHYCQEPTEAIRKAMEIRPTVILLDLVMPEIDGLTLLRFFRANALTRLTPIVVLSTKEEPKTKAEAFAVGASDYLVKLPDRIELIARIRHHSGGYINLLQRNEAHRALQESLEQLRIEQEKSERLLLNILPKAIADRLKQGQATIADSFPEVTILFADLVGFTSLSSRIQPAELVRVLNEIFSTFDRLVEKHGLEKIKTIGDSYMVGAGLPIPRADHAEAIAEMALDILEEMSRFSKINGSQLSMRMGINTGPVVAGVIGTKKFIYDLWGDTVNTASRMESSGVASCIQVTETTYQKLKEKYILLKRGSIDVKGKGEMTTYLLAGRKPAAPNEPALQAIPVPV
ncbi:MAG TPA: adenylate/guanylate cyclase domain-containing protein [Acidobacteriota bacterium]|nr:adenylate/guanylate cyclase domain-containing protein [Acidobacteriota bacterium]